MKFIKNFKLYLIMALIYLAIFPEVKAFETILKHHSKFILTLKKTARDKTYPFDNPLGNFVAGLNHNLFGRENEFLQCFPYNWKNPSSLKSEEESLITGNMGGWIEGLDKFANLAGKFVDFFCKHREKVITFFEKLFLKKPLRNHRKLNQEESTKRALKFLKIRFCISFNPIKTSKRKFKRNMIKAQNTSNRNKIIKGTAYNSVKDSLIDPLFEKAVQPIKNSLMNFINKVKDFFNSSIFLKIKGCIISLKNNFVAAKNIFEKLKTKLISLKTAISLGLPGIIIYVVDFIVALVCEYKSVIQGIKLISEAIYSSDRNHKLWQFGKALGTLLKTFAFTQTYADRLLKNID